MQLLILSFVLIFSSCIHSAEKSNPNSFVVPSRFAVSQLISVTYSEKDKKQEYEFLAQLSKNGEDFEWVVVDPFWGKVLLQGTKNRHHSEIKVLDERIKKAPIDLNVLLEDLYQYYSKNREIHLNKQIEVGEGFYYAVISISDLKAKDSDTNCFFAEKLSAHNPKLKGLQVLVKTIEGECIP